MALLDDGGSWGDQPAGSEVAVVAILAVPFLVYFEGFVCFKVAGWYLIDVLPILAPFKPVQWAAIDLLVNLLFATHKKAESRTNSEALGLLFGVAIATLIFLVSAWLWRLVV